MSSEGRAEASRVDSLFRTTGYAEHLRENPRWSRYKPEELSIKEWRDVLHADSDGLDQARLMIRLTDLFLQTDSDNSAELSNEDKELLFLASAMQNWGKSAGEDISYEFLTGEEIDSRRITLHKLFDELTPNLDVKKRFIIEKTIYDKSTRLGAVFDAIRRANCLRTAVIAYSAYREDKESLGHEHLGALSLGVLSNQLTYLVTYAEQFEPIRQVLDSARGAIGQIFADRTIRDHPFVANQQTVEQIDRTEVIWSRSHGDKSRTPGGQKRGKENIFSPDSAFETRYIEDKERLRQVVESLRGLGMTITLTSGSFDLLHIGHAKYLERAAEFGDVLVVGVDSDEKIRERKGPSRPVVGEDERLKLLSHIRGVGLLTLKHPDEEKWGLIKLIRPDTLIVTAETYTPAEIKELETNFCRRVVVLEPQATTSTGAQIRKIQIGERTELVRQIDEALATNNLPETLRRVLGSVIETLHSEKHS